MYVDTWPGMHDYWLFNWVPIKIYSPYHIFSYVKLFSFCIHITRYFHCQNHEKCVYFFHPFEHNPRQLSPVDQSKNYTGYTWEMCVTFGVCFRFRTLLFFQIYVTQLCWIILTFSKTSRVWIDCYVR